MSHSAERLGFPRAQHDQRFIETSRLQLLASGLSWDVIELSADERRVVATMAAGDTQPEAVAAKNADPPNLPTEESLRFLRAWEWSQLLRVSPFHGVQLPTS